MGGFGRVKNNTKSGSFPLKLRGLGLKGRYATVFTLLIISVVSFLSAILLSQFSSSMHKMTLSSQESMTTDLLSQIEKRGKFMVQLLAENLVNPLYNFDVENIQGQLAAVKSQDDVMFVVLFDSMGKVIHDGTIEIEGYGTPWFGHRDMQLLSTLPSVMTKFVDQTLIVSSAVTIGETTLGGLSIGLSLKKIWSDIDLAKNRLNKISRKSSSLNNIYVVVTMLILVIVAIALSFSVAGELIRPIREITDYARRVGRGDYDHSIPSERSDELGDLIITFNQMGQELRSTTVSKNYMEGVIGSMVDSLVVLDNKGRIELVNRALCHLLGFNKEELLEANFESLFQEQDRQDVRIRIKSLKKQESIIQMDRCFLASDGKIIPVSVSVSAIYVDMERVGGIVCVAQVITERLRIQKELQRAKADAEMANRSKSAFLANMSHELRTPLNHIIGFTEMVVDEDFGTLNSSQGEYLRDSLNSSRHLLSLINDILDLSKVEAGKVEISYAEVNITLLLESCLSMFKEQGSRRNLQLLSYVKDIPDFMHVDERMIKQVVLNLLSNAVKFTPENGKIILSARCVSSQDLESTKLSYKRTIFSGIEISVVDSGVGLGQEHLKSIFKPFEQSPEDQSLNLQGTGLGLALCRQFVELHGGMIWAESKGKGMGSCFKIRLPYESDYMYDT